MECPAEMSPQFFFILVFFLLVFRCPFNVPLKPWPSFPSITCSQEDVVNLDLTMFLRLNGARKIGIGTSFALPVVSRWGVTFVIVFYTRDKIKVCLSSHFISSCA